jgi:hypothetical protein
LNRTNPFGLIIILNSNGNAQGDLFYDDGESIDTIERKSYYYSTFQWSSSNQQLTMNIIQNNYFDIIDVGLPMNKNYTFTWSNTTSLNIESPKILSTNPKYRVDCFPDPGY